MSSRARWKLFTRVSMERQLASTTSGPRNPVRSISEAARPSIPTCVAIVELLDLLDALLQLELGPRGSNAA